MKKRFVSVLLASTMVAGMVAGCGSSSSSTETAATEAATEAAAETEATDDVAEAETADAAEETEAAADEGKVLNIQCWNEEFKSRLEDHYPGYEKVDDTTGKIGDVTVKFPLLRMTMHIRTIWTAFFPAMQMQQQMIRRISS